MKVGSPSICTNETVAIIIWSTSTLSSPPSSVTSSVISVRFGGVAIWLEEDS